MRSRHFPILSATLALSLLPSPARAFTFTDSFTASPSPSWSNLRGNWSAHDGVYDAASPTNSPPTNTSLPYNLADLSLDLDINSFTDGGIWLRSDAGAHNGVLLVTGGGGYGSGVRDSQAGNSLYFHLVHNDSYSPITNRVFPGITPTTNHHLHVTVVGDTYSVYLDNSPTPAVTLTTPDFPVGRVGLYDYSSTQTFDNVSLSATLPGDTLPYDDVVDLNDLNHVLNNFGSNNPAGLAFPKTAGTVDLNDLNMVLNNFGNHAPAPSGLSVIPEPASLAACTLTLLLRSARRKHTYIRPADL